MASDVADALGAASCVEPGEPGLVALFAASAGRA
jgi:hypothetical protein